MLLAVMTDGVRETLDPIATEEVGATTVGDSEIPLAPWYTPCTHPGTLPKKPEEECASMSTDEPASSSIGGEVLVVAYRNVAELKGISSSQSQAVMIKA